MATTDISSVACDQRGRTPTRDPHTWSHSVPEAGKQVGISDRTTYRLIERGLLRSYKVGHSRRVLHADLADYIARQREAG